MIALKEAHKDQGSKPLFFLLTTMGPTNLGFGTCKVHVNQLQQSKIDNIHQNYKSANQLMLIKKKKANQLILSPSQEKCFVGKTKT